MKRARLGLVLAIALGACAPAAQTSPSTIDAPAEIQAAALAVLPDLVITGGEQSDDEYELAGTLPNGDEVELDMMQTDGVWRVVEIQRDIAWAEAPEVVRSAAAAAPNAFEPTRVIESRQPADGSVVYELFAADTPPGAPALEVRWHEGEAAVLPPAH